MVKNKSSKTASKAPRITASKGRSKTVSKARSKTVSKATASKRKLHFSHDVDTQKECNPGPNVLFDKRYSSILQYLHFIDSKGGLGCRKEQYPTFIDGKYCCSTKKNTNQEKYDYIMKIFKSIVENVNDTELEKQVVLIKALRKHFDKLIVSDASLIRNRELESEYLNTIDTRVNGLYFTWFGSRVI